jgi:hypothetical protein
MCAMHSGLSDPKEMGRAGGLKTPETELRKAVKHDDALREKARKALEAALDGDDEKRRFEAAKSLYSFRAAAPPAEYEQREPGQRAYLGTGLGEVVALACQLHALSQSYGVPIELEDELAEALSGAGTVETPRPPENFLGEAA